MKGKVGKPKVKKMNLEETLPSPFARRVEPPTQPIKADAAKKLTKKKKVRAPPGTAQSGPRPSHTLHPSSQSDVDLAVKLEFDEDGLGGEGGAGDNSVAKAKAPRVRKEKKEPGTDVLPVEAPVCLDCPLTPLVPFRSSQGEETGGTQRHQEGEEEEPLVRGRVQVRQRAGEQRAGRPPREQVPEGVG